MSEDPVSLPPEVTHGRMWLDDADPAVLRLEGEVDQPVVRSARYWIDADRLAAVRVVDMQGVSFVDSSVISVIANLVLGRSEGAPPLVLRHVPEIALVVLEISGLTASVTLAD